MTLSLFCAGEAACKPAVECYRRRQTTDDDRCQRPLLLSAPCTMCRRASNNSRWVNRHHCTRCH